jgi:SAM-dependent methyltransferase
MQDQAAEKAFYEDLFEKDSRNVHINYGYEEIYDAVFPKQATGELLDLGCGTGDHSIRLADRGFTVTAVDLTWRGVVAARERFREKGLQVDVLVADAEYLPFKESSFDIAWTSLLLHHFPVLDKLPLELKRIVRKTVVALEPNAGNFLSWFAFNVINPIFGISSTTKNQRSLWPKRLHPVFERIGFKVAAFEFVHRPWRDKDASAKIVRRVANVVIDVLPMPYKANKFVVSYEKLA